MGYKLTDLKLFTRFEFLFEWRTVEKRKKVQFFEVCIISVLLICSWAFSMWIRHLFSSEENFPASFLPSHTTGLIKVCVFNLSTLNFYVSKVYISDFQRGSCRLKLMWSISWSQHATVLVSTVHGSVFVSIF